jgi:hypothetical protein
VSISHLLLEEFHSKYDPATQHLSIRELVSKRLLPREQVVVKPAIQASMKITVGLAQMLHGGGAAFLEVLQC